MVPEHNRELGELSTKIDGLATLVETSHSTTNRAIELNRTESSRRHGDLTSKLEDATQTVSQLRTDHETLKANHKSTKAETHRSVNRLWQVLLGSGAFGTCGLIIFKVVAG